MSRWRVAESRRGPVHILPVLDYVLHEESPRCVCGPAVELSLTGRGTVGALVRHQSLDRREDRERAGG